ncbi:MAG: hypothetical protein IPH07_37185 [Deltaproteobacteria bacterium]|nr:hypothetical protein [Deltaproteobacteria bacterium]
MEWPSGVARIASQPLLRVALLPVVAGGAWLTDGLLRWLLTGAALVLLPELLPELLPRLRARFGADALARAAARCRWRSWPAPAWSCCGRW